MKIKALLIVFLLLGCHVHTRGDDAASPAGLIHNGTRASLSLNGSWQVLPITGLTFAYPPPEAGWKDEAVPERDSAVINTPNGPYVPPVSEMLNADGTGLKRTDGMAAWYRRDFEMPATSLTGVRAMLHFGGMAFRSETWVNGTKVGTSVLGLLPLDYDITNLLRVGQVNHVVVGLAGREALVDVAAKTFIAPNGGMAAGIYGDVALRLVPEVSVGDVFVKTFVGAKRLEVEVTVSNTGTSARTVQPQVTILDSEGVPQTSIQGEALTVSPGQTQTVTLKNDWLAPHLWSPQTPSLYTTKIELRSAGSLIDSQEQRFGFREFEIRGKDFFLNGKRTVLLRDSLLTDVTATPETARGVVRSEAGQPYNTFRLHLGFNNEALIEAADEAGVMLTPEFGYYHTDAFAVGQSAAWLPNTLDYMKQFVRLHRNHPSIVIWNLDNETFWGDTDEAKMKIGDQIVDAVRSLDPTRPQEADGDEDWGGRLPILNVHYPEGAGQLRKQYVNSGYLEPNDLYWFSDTGVNQSWPNNSFVWDRPLVIGEYWDPGAISNEEKTSFTGEEGYDYQKWSRQDRSGRDGQPSEYFDYLKRATDVYRLRGVAGVNPWGGRREDVMPPVAVRPLDFHPNFFGGRTGTRKVVVFNDTGDGFNSMNLQCSLILGGVTVWDKTIEAYVEPGKNRVFDIAFPCPAVSRATKATLFVRLRYEWGGRWAELSRHEETIYVLPAERGAAQDVAGVVLLDTTGATATALRQLGVPVPAKTTLTATDLSKATTLVIGAGTEAQPFRALIGAFVRRGGRVLLLSQKYRVPLLPELAQTDDTHVATRTWIRSYGHPILSGVSEAQLSFWQPDNIVSTLTLQKPAVGQGRAVIDAGGRFGLNWAPLLETAVGRGVALQSQLNLVDRIEQEPLAGHLLLAMLRYCRSYQSPSRQPLRVLVGNNAALKQTLAACSVVTTPGLAGQGPVLLDSSYVPSASELQALKRFLGAGGKVWLHGFGSASVASVASLFPFKPQMAAFDPAVQSAVRRSDDPLLSNVSSQEFYWTRTDFGVGGDFYNKAQPTAKLGGEVLALPSPEAGETLIEPGLLVKVPSGKGVLLFDTLSWEDALGAETDKVSRLVTSLALNLGADVQIQAEKNYAYSQADLSKQANMGFYDEVAGDGKGGWTDQGENDMRFFLINHTGKAGGAAAGMEVMESAFPTSVTFAGRPFRLIDPKANDGRSVITLRSQGHDPTLPAQATGIPFGHKAEKLWFLHTACWAVSNTQHQEVGRYVIHYEDGTQSVFPLRYGLEVSDWWDPKPLSNGKVAWSGKNGMHSPVGIYVSEWSNPKPAKIIQSIDLIGNKSEAQIVLLGISGGVEANAAASYKPVADWDLGKAVGGKIVSRVGSGTLAFGSGANAPTPVQAGGVSALRFRHGQSLTAEGKLAPGLGAGGPMSLQVVLTPEDKPDGYMGGLYEHMDYLKSGFRLALTQQMQVNVEIFPGDGRGRYLVSRTPLAVGQTYRVELKFDGQRAYLFLNDRLDTSLETPPPAPCDARILIGQASGKDYNFNGSISRVSVGVPGD